MTKDFLIQELQKLETALRVNRLRISGLVLDNPKLMPFLIEIVFEVDNKLSVKAAWVLEYVLTEKLDWIAPYLEEFTLNIGKLYFGSAVRPAAKICGFIAKAYTSKNNSIVKETLTKKQIDRIIEAGFDWMISQHKVAVKAYTMTTLFLLGKNYDWVHPELQLILQQNITKESAAYKARGKITLGLINKQ